MSVLPIESYPELLTEYGRAFAWFNLAEYSLNIVMLVKGGLIKANVKMTNQLLDEMMFGKKIQLAKNFLDEAIIKKLWQLNDKRLILAHGVSGEKAPINNPTLKTGNIVIGHKQKEHVLDKKFLADAIKLAKEISEILRQEITKR